MIREMLSYFGSYTVNETDRSLNFAIERSAFPNQAGAQQKRVITALTAEELKFSNLTPVAGGRNDFVWKRAQ